MMWKEWLKVWRARGWMKKNQGFLPTWHAYVGYKLDLFALLTERPTFARFVEASRFDRQLLESWVDVGLAIGHLRKNKQNEIACTQEMNTYFNRASRYAIGELLVEMLELHMPALLQYPKMMTAGYRMEYDDSQYARTVAATSSFIEEAAFPVLLRWIKKQHIQSVFDIGCGYAGYLLRLARTNRSLKLFGIEKDEALLNSALDLVRRENLSAIELVQGDFLTNPDSKQMLPPDTREVDLVMMNNLLYYFEPAMRMTLINRAADMLSKGGSLTIISPLRGERTTKPFTAAFNTFMRAHSNLFDLPTIGEIEAAGEGAGLQLVTAEPLIREGNWYFCGLRKM